MVRDSGAREPDYLIDLPQREFEGVRRLFQLPWIADGFFGSLGLPMGSSWFATEVPFERFTTDSKGDVDILGGRLAAGDGGSTASEAEATSALAMDYLVAIEVKCAYLDPEGARIRSAKDSAGKRAHTQLQLRKLLDLGFDRVVLLDIIATPPSTGADGQAWLRAGSLAIDALDIMRPALERRLEPNSPIGHWVWPIGAVVGGDESMCGAGAPIELRGTPNNPLLKGDGVPEVREHVNHGLRALLGQRSLSHGPPFLCFA